MMIGGILNFLLYQITARSNDIDAFEVRDMENDIDYDDLNARVTSLEKVFN